MNNRRQNIGRWGEDVAAKYLVSQGYTLLARNLRTGRGEIDIVACKEDRLIFVEVKTRSSNAFGFPETAVTPKKQKHMLAAAEQYLQDNPDSSDTWQFDVIAVERVPGHEPVVTQFENVLS